MTYPTYIDTTERQIIDWIVKDALKMGCLVQVFGEGEIDVDLSDDYQRITENIGITEITNLVLVDGNSRRRVGQIDLVHGNGCDVISDHTDTAEMAQLLTNATLTAKRLEGGAA